MRMEREDWTVRQILELLKNGMLKANPEYQRGVVWTLKQKKKLIDSVMRGYPLLLIYLHHKKKSIAGMQREDLEIVDGQQRINALYEFAESAFTLFHPQEDDRAAQFPDFLKKLPCPWAHKNFHSLDDQLKELFLDTKLAVAKIYTDLDVEVRDLFVRLQAGTPLNSQERRDALPGEFTEFVLRLGGEIRRG
jgi:uncharacterized protein with ParB-like and HNH nuclease domain